MSGEAMEEAVIAAVEVAEITAGMVEGTTLTKKQSC